MIEVEAKVSIGDPNKFRKLVKKLGKFKGRTKKIDDYYALGKLKEYKKRTLRIRKTGNHYEVNIKNKISYVKGVHAKREVELKSTSKGSLPAFVEIIKDLGFKRWLRKEKTTELYEIKKNFIIEINNVKGLGWFIEVEYLSDLKGIKKARDRVVKIINKLGVSEKEIIKDGYTKMMWNKGLRGF